MKAGIAPMKYMRHYLYIKGNKNHIFIDIYKYKYMTIVLMFISSSERVLFYTLVQYI